MKKLMMAVACVCALGLFADEGPIYLKADATGTGDGSSWENAMTSARDAIVLADTSGRPVYAARGYYKVSSGYTLTKGLAIYGGFPGASMSETLADRDPAKYQTIFTSASNKPDIKWNHAAPQSGQFKISVAALDAAANPVFVQDEDGYDVFNPPPAPEGEFDGYYISGGNNVTMVTVAKDTGLAADGIWFIGLANGYPFTIQAINDNCGVRTVSNCRFFGSRGPFTTNSGHDNKDILTVRISNCEFRYTYNLKPVVQTYGRHTIIEDCAFSDHFRTDVKDGCNVIWVWYINATIRGCSFARCAAVTQSSGESDTNYNGTNLIGWNAASILRLEDCTMSNNVSMAQYGYGCSLFGCKGASLCNLTVVNNRLEVKARAAGTYSLVTGTLRSTATVGYENCLFASNTVAEVVGDADTYALGILGNGIERNNVCPIVNCTFIDNEVTTVGSAANVIRSQGVLFNDSAAANSRMAVVNCTFARSQEDAGIYDVAQYGSAINDFYVINSISMRGPNAQFDPFYAETPSKFKVRSCTVGGYLAVPDWLDAEEISSDAVPLEWLALGGGRAALRPACRLGSLRESVDVSVCTRKANVIEPEERAYYTSYMIRNDADTGWIALTGETAPKTALGLLADATDTEERPAGSFTRGPVQALSASAEWSDVTMDVYGTLNILGTTTSAGVYADLRNATQIAGIMLGHYAGTSALNVYGLVDAPKADLLIGYTCAGTLTIDGGTVRLHGLTNQAGGIRNDKGRVVIKNNGVLELAAWPVRNVAQPGTMPIEIAGGTIRATGDWTCPWPMTITDDTVFDANGHKIVFSGALEGAGRLTVTDSSNGKGSVSLLGDLSAYTGALTVDAKVQSFGVAAGTGSPRISSGTPGGGQFSCQTVTWSTHGLSAICRLRSSTTQVSPSLPFRGLYIP